MNPGLVFLILFLGWLVVAVLLRKRLSYFYNVYLGFDQFVNAVLAGDPDETISSRLGKALRRPRRPAWARALCWVLDRIDPGHCESAIEVEEGKDAVPIAMALVCLVWIAVSVLAMVR